MKIDIEATPQELQDKGTKLIKAMAIAVRDHNPELANKLDESIHEEEQKRQLRDPYLRSLQDQAQARYQRGMASAQSEITGLFDTLEKSKDQHLQSSLIEALAKK